MIVEVLDGLAVAHTATVHRDIKPENILVPVNGQVRAKICDFGLAQLQSRWTLLSSGQVMGTYNYMAPEQQIDSKVDLRADLYSLGVVFYEGLTGRFPVGRFKLPSRLRSDLPPEVDEFIEKALDPEPKERFQEAQEMQQALLQLVGEIPAATASDGTRPERRAMRAVERGLRELREKLPPRCLDDFVAKHHAAWGYEDYRELVAKLGQEIGEFDEAQLSELMEEARHHYRERSKSGSTRQSRIEQKFAANLCRVEASGLIGQFVCRCGGDWQEGEWQELLAQLERDGFYPLDEERLRAAVHQESERYRQGRERAKEHKRMLAALEKGRQYQDGLDYLAEVRGEGYWDEELQQCYDRLNSRCREYAAAVAAGREALTAKQWEQAAENLRRAEELIAGEREVGELLKTAESELAEQRRCYWERKWRESGFTYLRTGTYSCGGQRHTVEEYRHDKTGLEFVLIPEGSFAMGSNDGNSNEKPVHEVRLSSFLLSKTEVTQAVWQRIMKTTPWQGERYVQKGANNPAVYVSWEDAVAFCERTGLCLPTEAQWEYACRAGTTTKYYWGDSMDGAYCWYDGNAWDKGERYAHQVGQKQANAFGLYDMSGNVWEWCQDWYDRSYYSKGENDNPRGPSTGSSRVLRGWQLLPRRRLLSQRQPRLPRAGPPRLPRRRAFCCPVPHGIGRGGGAVIYSSKKITGTLGTGYLVPLAKLK